MGLLGTAAGRFLDRLPAFILAMLCLRTAELAAGIQADSTLAQSAWLAANALGVDLVNLIRYLPALFLYSLPFLVGRSKRRFWGLGIAWSLLILLQAALVQYFLTARVPLGADLFAYSVGNIRKIVIGGLSLDMTVLSGLVLALVGLWWVLFRRRDVQPKSTQMPAVILVGALMVMIAAPSRTDFVGFENEDARNIKLSKIAYFLDDSVDYLLRSHGPDVADRGSLTGKPGLESSEAGLRFLDPKYPFLRAEQTPDVLGPHFRMLAGRPPNLVFLVVEGLGRSFSGPDASLGSFTPQLDRLANQSLYWENFLAVQGRTFAILPSLFASLPFADNGFSMLGKQMPAHHSLLSVLKEQGYDLRSYSGFDSDFDNESIFLKRQGVDSLIDVYNFGEGYTRSNIWGYADADLITRALAGERHSDKQPFVTIIKTVTTHTPYTFRGQSAYYGRFEQRLEQLGISERRKAVYRAYRNIYTSILYVDDALGRFFEEAKKNPGYENTIFIIVGDHRLPEIPMATRIDRYHVPLIIFSPLLKAPARIKSVSSHFDITPSLLAFLSHNYNIKRPQAVTWLGSGLDMEPTFRNLHDFPLKQTKTNLVDYVSGTWFINQDRLYALKDGMEIEPADNPDALARLQMKFAAFRAANSELASSLALMPRGSDLPLAPVGDGARAKVAEVESVPVGTTALEVRAVTAPTEAKSGQLTIRVVFANAGTTTTDTFVPLVVLLTERGREVSESYGPPQRLVAGASVSLELPVQSRGVLPGRYFLSVLPVQPRTGKHVGAGRYRVAIRFND